MHIRVEEPADVDAIRQVTAAAFEGREYAAPLVDGLPGEAALVDWLRADTGWIPELSFVAEIDGEVVGHGVASRGHVDDYEALALGPLSVRPDLQKMGIGSALVHAILGAADERGETLVVLLGDPNYYEGFGFRESTYFAVHPPEPEWGDHFQALTLTAHDPLMAGTFRYAVSFDRI